MLTSEEKTKIVDYITRWSVKPLFEDDVIDYDVEKWRVVEGFLEECRQALMTWNNNQAVVSELEDILLKYDYIKLTPEEQEDLGGHYQHKESYEYDKTHPSLGMMTVRIEDRVNGWSHWDWSECLTEGDGAEELEKFLKRLHGK